MVAGQARVAGNTPPRDKAGATRRTCLSCVFKMAIALDNGEMYILNVLQNGGQYGNDRLCAQTSLEFMIPFEHVTPSSRAETEAPEAVTYHGRSANTGPADATPASAGNCRLRA